MKVIIILLLLVILLFFMYKNQENFFNIQVTQEMRDRYNREQLAELEEPTREEGSNRINMEFEHISNLERFNGLLGENAEQKKNFINDPNNGLGFMDRSTLLTDLFDGLDETKRYNHFRNFKQGQPNLDGVGTEYSNPNGIDYTTLFVEKFDSNIILRTIFKKPDFKIKIRYEIISDNSTISSGYIFNEEIAVDSIANRQIQCLKSPFSKRYEPYSNIFINTNIYNSVPDPVNSNRRYPNYYKDLHKLMIDLRNSNSLETIRNNYLAGQYKIAFEDFNKVSKNISNEYLSDFKKVVLRDGNLIEEEITQDQENEKPTDILFNGDIREIETRLFVSPGDYKLKIIVESENRFNDLFISMKYNFNSDIPIDESVLTFNDNPISYLNFLSNRNSQKKENLSYLKINVDNFKEELTSIKNRIENNILDEKEEIPHIVNSNINAFFPERVYFYVNLVLFKLLFSLRKNLGLDNYTGSVNPQHYSNLMLKLERFLQLFMERPNDDRILQNPSQRYRNLEQEIEQLSEDQNPSETIILLITQKTRELDLLRLQELQVETPYQPDTERLNFLNSLYRDIISDESLESVKNLLNQSSIDNIIDKYLGQHLLNNINIYEGRNENEKSEITRVQYLLRLEQFIEQFIPDIDGKVSNSLISDENLSAIYDTVRFQDYNFSVEIKAQPTIEVESTQDPEPITPPEEVVLDEYTLLVRRVIRLVKRDFKKIVKMKKYNNLDPELEGILKNIKRSSKMSNPESKEKYLRMIDIILNLVDKIKDGSIDDINDLIELDTNSYQFPNEVIVETFSNINIMRPIVEHFDGDVDLHKHTSEGRINFGLTWGNPLEKANEGRYDEYSLLSEESKKKVLDSYGKIQNAVIKTDFMVNNFVNGMEEKINKVNYEQVRTQTNNAIEQLEKTQEEKDKIYGDTEKKQNERIARISEKVRELEKLQNKKYLGDLDTYNSIKTFGDGQVISVKNYKSDIYNILVNEECLDYDKKGNISTSKCSGSKSQQFKMNLIEAQDKYNTIVVPNGSEPVNEYSGVNYPFHVLNPVLHQSQCLTLNGNSVGVKACENSKNQRWQGMKNIKLCDNFNMN